MIPIQKRNMLMADEEITCDPPPLKRRIIVKELTNDDESILYAVANKIMQSLCNDSTALGTNKENETVSSSPLSMEFLPAQDQAEDVADNQDVDEKPKKRLYKTMRKPRIIREPEEKFLVDRKIVKRLKQYVEKAANLPGCSKAELLKNLVTLRTEYEAQPDKTDMDQVIHIMEETYKLRFNEMFNSMKLEKSWDAIYFYPALAIPEYLPYEYTMLFPKKLAGTKLIEKIKTLMYAQTDAVTAAHKRNKTSTRALKAVKKNNTDRTLRLIVGSILHMEEKSEGKAEGALYFQSSVAPRVQPCIKVNSKLKLWDNPHPMQIYIEGQETGCQAYNFFEALVCVYFYFWIFYLDYPSMDKTIFEAFDKFSGP